MANITFQEHIVDKRTIEGDATFGIFLFMIILITIMGNIAVIFAIWLNRHLREEASSLLIINLAITDFTNGSTVMVSSFVALVKEEWTLGQVVCDAVCALNYCLIITSMLTLCFISCDRYVAIIHPMHYQAHVTPTRILIAIIYAWFQGIVFAFVPVFYRWVGYDYWEVVCAIQWQREREQALYYVIVAFILCFLLPGLILIFNYTKILKEVKRNLVLPEVSNGNQKSGKYSTSSKAVRSLLFVVLAYFVCMSPFSITKLIKVIATTDNYIPGWINTTASLTGYCSSAINPLIYGIFRKDFRTGYKQFINKILRRTYPDSNFSI